jgi:cell division protein FtsI (penicillin-binding protein 3)
MNIKKDIVLRIRLAFLAVLLFSFAVLYKIIYIQQIDSARWEKLANENLLQYRVVKATRGNIYSDNESLLATSIPFYRLAMDPTVPNDEVFRAGIDSLSFLLARHFKGRKEDYYKKINGARRSNKAYIILNREMVNFQTQKMMSQWPIIREGKYKGGVMFEKVEKRFKPFSNLAARTIGFINENNTGVGLEKSYNNYLKGQDGEALFMRMGGGNWKPIHDESEIDAEPGVDIQTTLDINIQDVAEASLHRHLQMHDADYGCVVLMEVATGEIKAISNLGKVADGQYIENYNYAIAEQGLTDPGSTFKLASLIALFEDSELKLEDSIFAERGRYKFFDRVMTDSHEGGYGWLSVQEAFEKSSNIAVSKLVVKHFGANQQKYVDYIKGFGLADQLGLQMQGEAKPYVKNTSDKTWSGVTLPWMSIGYEQKLAPIHTLAFYNAIANNGKMIKPILVKEIRVADQVKERFETEVIKEKICSEKSIEMARKMLEGVVENGTARNINNAVYKIGGKTGTAQKIKNGKYTNLYFTSFCGYFPADKPKYSCIVIIDSPKGAQQYGSDVAAPVFKEIADKIYAVDLDLHEKFETVNRMDMDGFPLIKAGYYDDLAALCNFFGISNHTKYDSDEEWVSAIPTNKSITWNARKVKETLVPDATGMTLRDALFLLENHGLKVRVSGKGRVVSQSISNGARLVKGSTITIFLE